MHLRPISGALGAEVSGLDLQDALSDNALNNGVAAQLHDAFLKYHVLFFRGSELTPTQQIRLARQFGEPDEYPFLQGLPDAPEVVEILKTESDTLNFGGSWHSDTAYMEKPALGTILHAIEVPERGGDTLFANMAAAYDALSDGLKCALEGVTAVYSSDHGYKGGRAAVLRTLDGMKDAYQTQSSHYEAEHPIVRTHPETGRKSLYMSLGHTVRFSNMTEAESKPLLEYLHHHATQPEFVCRFCWTAGAVAIWDNRTTRHYALNDYAGQRRRMRRVTLKGDRPR